MKRIVGYLKELSKICFAKDAEGHLRGLQAGDPVYEGETIVDENGNIVLDALRTVTEGKVDKHLLETDIEGKLHDLDNDKNSRQMQHESHYPKSSTSTDMFEPEPEEEVRAEATLLNDIFTQEERTLFNENHILADVEENEEGNNTSPPSEINPPSEPDVPVSPSEPVVPIPPSNEQPEDINHAPRVDTPIPNQSDNDADTINLDVSGNFSDIDGDTLSFSASGLPAGLSIDAATGIISGTIDNSASQSGPYSVTVTVSDGNGGTVSDTFNWAVANPAPTAVNDSASTPEDTAITTGNVLTNDSDPDGDALSVTQFVVNGTTYTEGTTANLTEGDLTINSDGSYTFNPAANYNGTVPTATYTISDGEGGTDTADLVITVTPVNDAPVIDQVTLRQPARESLIFWNNMDEAASDKSDLAQNGHTATEVGTSTIYTIADDDAINTGTYDQKTIAASFTTGSVSASDPFQVIYEQGGAWNGYSISVKGDHIYASVWGESYSTIDPDYAIVDLGQISANTDYNVVMVHDGTAANGGTLIAYLDGVQNPDVKTGVGQMRSHSGDVGIDGYKNDTIDPTNPTANVRGDGGQFQGTVHEVMSWNSAQSSTVNEIINYFNANNDTTTKLEARLSGTIELFDVDASDVEDGTALTYTLQNDFGGLFSVDASSGVVSVNADELFQSNTYTLNVEAVDSDGATASTALTVDVKGSEVVHLDMNGQVNDIADSGTVVDNGQLHNGASVSNGDTLVLDGVDDYLDFANSADINQGTHLERSVALWFKTADSSGTQYVYAEGGGIRSLQIYTENGILKAKGYNDPDSENGWKAANATVLNTNINVADNQWHHVAITTAGDPNDPLHGLDANGFKIYLDGTLQASGTGGAIYGHDNAHIGSYYNGTQTFDGEIDGFRLYNDELTAAQIQELNSATVIDGIVSGLYYETAYGLSGFTDDDGSFAYRKGDTVTFKVGDVTIGSVNVDDIDDGKIFLQDIADISRTDLDNEYVENMAVFLQSLDSDGNPDNGIDIDTTVHMAFEDEAIDLSALSDEDLATVVEEAGYDVVDKESAMEHVGNMLETYGGVKDDTSAEHANDEGSVLEDPNADNSTDGNQSDVQEEDVSQQETSDKSVDMDNTLDDAQTEDEVLTDSETSPAFTDSEGSDQENTPESNSALAESDDSDTNGTPDTLQLDDIISNEENQESVDNMLPPASDIPENIDSSEGTVDTVQTDSTAAYDPTVVITVDDQISEAA